MEVLSYPNAADVTQAKGALEEATCAVGERTSGKKWQKHMW